MEGATDRERLSQVNNKACFCSIEDDVHCLSDALVTLLSGAPLGLYVPLIRTLAAPSLAKIRLRISRTIHRTHSYQTSTESLVMRVSHS